jgi:uncharacterized membrane protein YsdA (DUF1294 family)
MLIAAIWITLASAIAAFRFWSDKQRAIEGRRRIPEADLLGIALIGGSPGALIARQVFRHKTRKEPFSTQLMMIVAIQAGIVVGLFML